MMRLLIKQRRKATQVSMYTQTFMYTVMYCESEYGVCKKGFCSIFGIVEKSVWVAMEKVTLAKATVSDQRGVTPTATKSVGQKGDLMHTHTSRCCQPWPTIIFVWNLINTCTWRWMSVLSSSMTCMWSSWVINTHMLTWFPFITTVKCSGMRLILGSHLQLLTHTTPVICW